MDMGPFLLNFSLLFLFSTFVLSSAIPTVKTVAASVLGARGGGHTGRVSPYFIMSTDSTILMILLM